jgi:hypothetical protein
MSEPPFAMTSSGRREWGVFLAAAKDGLFPRGEAW